MPQEFEHPLSHHSCPLSAALSFAVLLGAPEENVSFLCEGEALTIFQFISKTRMVPTPAPPPCVAAVYVT